MLCYVKRSSECWLLIGHKTFFVFLCQFGEQYFLNFLCVRRRRPLSSHTCLVRSPRLRLQGKFSPFLTKNEGTTDDSAKRFGWYQEDHSNLTEKILFLINRKECVIDASLNTCVSSSLYFSKSVFKIPLLAFPCFSFRVESILKWAGFISN